LKITKKFSHKKFAQKISTKKVEIFGKQLKSPLHFFKCKNLVKIIQISFNIFKSILTVTVFKFSKKTEFSKIICQLLFECFALFAGFTFTIVRI